MKNYEDLDTPDQFIIASVFIILVWVGAIGVNILLHKLFGA
jgi:hypothetical protein